MRKTLPNHEIFKEYFTKQNFVDRFKRDKSASVDVIIPIIHTNELWEQNLISIYREIPVNRLLISDGGCIDNSLEVLRKFPRVKIYDHKKIVSLGYCIRKLIEQVETDWFVYLHSDVYLPQGWFEIMQKHKKNYDWFECRQHITALVDYPLDYTGVDRSFSGSQMGRKEAFEKVLPKIDDDYLYRNEDIIYSSLITKEGYRYGRVDDTFHYHQLMYKRSKWERNFKAVDFIVQRSPEEEFREFNTQTRGLIKYMPPSKQYATVINPLLDILDRTGKLDWPKYKEWIKETNPGWLKYIRRGPTVKKITGNFLRSIYRFFFG